MSSHTAFLVAAILALPVSAAAPSQSSTPPVDATTKHWHTTLAERLPAFGHRNWIAIVDSAYPAQTSPGVETVVTHWDHLAVVKHVLDSLAKARHVRPNIYLDAELEHVAEGDAPGIGETRAALAKVLGDRPVEALPHGEIINRLDAAGVKFRVLILKTNLALPYTSVFIELDCGYWSADAEQRLRQKLAAAAQ